MSAPVRVRNERIREAITKANGNVTAAARDVGMAAINIRRRLEDLGIGHGELARLRGQQRSVRVSVELYERLRAAKFDLMHAMRTELGEGDVLEMFGETFDEWLAQRLERQR